MPSPAPEPRARRRTPQGGAGRDRGRKPRSGRAPDRYPALPHLRRTRGSIVNVSSTYGHRPLPGAAHYAASKAALEHLTRSWAVELAGDGVRVNALAPGPTESQALAAAGVPDTMIQQIKRDEAARIPLGRRGEPEEVATWILRMADPATTWLTGQVLTIDGGLELT